MEVLESGRKKIKDIESQLDELSFQKSKIQKESSLKIEFLQQEMKKNVNTQYIKNIILKFFSSDISV